MDPSLVMREAFGTESCQSADWWVSFLDFSERRLNGYFVMRDGREGSSQSSDVTHSAIRCKVLAVAASEGDRGFHFERARIL
jgi:hypothetical protein